MSGKRTGLYSPPGLDNSPFPRPPVLLESRLHLVFDLYPPLPSLSVSPGPGRSCAHSIASSGGTAPTTTPPPSPPGPCLSSRRRFGCRSATSGRSKKEKENKRGHSSGPFPPPDRIATRHMPVAPQLRPGPDRVLLPRHTASLVLREAGTLSEVAGWVWCRVAGKKQVCPLSAEARETEGL